MQLLGGRPLPAMFGPLVALLLLALAAPTAAQADRAVQPELTAVYARAARLPRLHSLLVQHRGQLVGERYWRGASATRRANIKSASKSVLAALVGIAIAEGKLRDLDQPIGELLPDQTRSLEPRKRAITVGDLLTMRAGLQSTSFDNYGSWTSSRDWTRDALRRPFVADLGGAMVYSTGSSHLLSAILTRATRTSTYDYARTRLARPLGIDLRPWQRDPQGIYFGGNDMYLTPREMVEIGALYARGGVTRNGTRLLSPAWIAATAIPRGTSPWNGHRYGYGWWIRQSAGRDVLFAWGYGGQYIFVVPSVDLVVVTTSDPNVATRGGDHLDAIHALLDEIVPAFEPGAKPARR